MTIPALFYLQCKSLESGSHGVNVAPHRSDLDCFLMSVHWPSYRPRGMSEAKLTRNPALPDPSSVMIFLRIVIPL